MAANEIQKDHARLLENLRVLQKAFSVKRCAGFIGKSEGAWRYKNERAVGALYIRRIESPCKILQSRFCAALDRKSQNFIKTE